MTAGRTAQSLGFSKGTTIYFAVDFDCMEYEAEEHVIPYFRAIKQTFDNFGFGYKIGIYAPRRVCTILEETGYTNYSFVADMSTGFSGNLGFPIPNNWAFDQFHEYQFSSSPPFDLDKATLSGKDDGCGSFNTAPDKTYEESLQEARDSYTRNFLKSINALNNDYVTKEFTYDSKEYKIGQVSAPNAYIDLSFYCSGNLSIPGQAEYAIKVTYKNDGGLTQDCLNKIKTVSDVVKEPNPNSSLNSVLQKIALTVKSGTIIVRVKAQSDTSIIVEVTSTSDLNEKYGVVGSVSVILKMFAVFGSKFVFDGIPITEIDLSKVALSAPNWLGALGFGMLEGVCDWLTSPYGQALGKALIIFSFILYLGRIILVGG